MPRTFTRNPRHAGWTPDAYQQAIIDSTSDAIRVVGLAGSGKTQTIAQRLINRVHAGTDPDRILIIAFDDAGKSVFSNKLQELDATIPFQHIRTMDELGGIVLRNVMHQHAWTVDPAAADRIADAIPIAYAGWEPQFHVANHDIFYALKTQTFAGQLTAERQSQAARWLYQSYFRRERSLEGNVASHASRATPDHISMMMPYVVAFMQYEDELFAQGILGREDQRIRAFNGLLRNKKFRDQVQAATDHIIVDEAQDLNRSEALLIRQFLGDQTSILLAGDDDQTVHAYRQAQSVFLRQPRRHFGRHFQTYDLQLNYRSPQQVLDPATRLIGHNNERISKAPQAVRQERGNLGTVASTTHLHLEMQVVKQVRQALQSAKKRQRKSRQREDLALLVMTNDEMVSWKGVLLRAGIAVREASGSVTTPAVEVLPMRMAKGREWHTVFLPTLQDTKLPGPVRTLDDLEDARRLLYMAITRSRNDVVFGFTWDDQLPPLTMVRGEVVGTNGPSRLLHEAGVIDVGLHPHIIVEPTISPQVNRPAWEVPEAESPQPPSSTQRHPKAPAAPSVTTEILIRSPKLPSAPPERASSTGRHQHPRERIMLAEQRLVEGDVQFAVIGAAALLWEYLNDILPSQPVHGRMPTFEQRLDQAASLDRISMQQKRDIHQILDVERMAQSSSRAEDITLEQGRSVLLQVARIAEKHWRLPGLADSLFRASPSVESGHYHLHDRPIGGLSRDIEGSGSTSLPL
jgi:superfamily I DNA/RNA helicase